MLSPKSRLFWTATFERAAKTFSQSMLAILGTNAASVTSMAIHKAIIVSSIGAGLSVLTSLASDQFGQPGPSLTSETIEPDTVLVEIPVPVPAPAQTPAKKSAPKKAAAKKSASK